MIISVWLEFYLRDIQINVCGSFFLSVCVCVFVFTFSTSMFISHSRAIFYCHLEFDASQWISQRFFFFSQFNKLLVKSNREQNTCIQWLLFSWYNCCCVKRTKKLKGKTNESTRSNTSMSSIIVRLFISHVEQRKNCYRIKSSKFYIDLPSTISQLEQQKTATSKRKKKREMVTV